MKPTLTFLRGWLLLLALVALPHAAFAQATWQLTVGTQSPDCQFIEGRHSAADCQMLQGMAFEPNEIWIHAGDSINWTHRTDEPHTVTFLQSGQVRPSNGVGCTSIGGSVAALNNSDYDPLGSASQRCVNSGRMEG